MGYMHHQRSEVDRRSVRVSLTEKGRNVRVIVAKLFATRADGLMTRGVLDHQGMDDISTALRRVERYWTEQIRYIY
jgi:DNA-binding MarR family transcriptional regulator